MVNYQYSIVRVWLREENVVIVGLMFEFTPPKVLIYDIQTAYWQTNIVYSYILRNKITNDHSDFVNLSPL